MGTSRLWPLRAPTGSWGSPQSSCRLHVRKLPLFPSRYLWRLDHCSSFRDVAAAAHCKWKPYISCTATCINCCMTVSAQWLHVL